MLLPGYYLSMSTSSLTDCASNYWIECFLAVKGNEIFCDIDEQFILDRFNLLGLNTNMPFYKYALETITDQFKKDVTQDVKMQVERSANHLYGLIHSRFIVTSRGLAKMAEKFSQGDFGTCPRFDCENFHLLPAALSDQPCQSHVYFYCGNCEDLYVPKSNRYLHIDGAYFGTSFPHFFFLTFPTHLRQERTPTKKYVPKMFGFRLNGVE